MGFWEGNDDGRALNRLTSSTLRWLCVHCYTTCRQIEEKHVHGRRGILNGLSTLWRTKSTAVWNYVGSIDVEGVACPLGIAAVRVCVLRLGVLKPPGTQSPLCHVQHSKLIERQTRAKISFWRVLESKDAFLALNITLILSP